MNRMKARETLPKGEISINVIKGSNFWASFISLSSAFSLLSGLSFEGATFKGEKMRFESISSGKT